MGSCNDGPRLGVFAGIPDYIQKPVPDMVCIENIDALQYPDSVVYLCMFEDVAVLIDQTGADVGAANIQNQCAQARFLKTGFSR